MDNKIDRDNSIETKQINFRMHILVLFAVYAFLGGIFYFAPDLDIKFSNLFYSESEGFAYAKTATLQILGYASKGIVLVVCLGALFVILKQFLSTKSLEWKLYKDAVFVLMVFMIGPVLLVQFGLKNYSHRPRPYSVVEFSGEQQFVKISNIGTGECKRNCSFPSGHAAVGFACICFAFLPRFCNKCTQIKIAGWTFGLLLGLSRIVGGYHFLSDVLFSGFFIYIIILCIHLCFYGNGIEPTSKVKT